MEKESVDFAFESEDSKHPPFIIRVKKTYTEEYSVNPNYDHWHHFTQKSEICYGASGRVNTDTTMETSSCESLFFCGVSESQSQPMNVTHDMNTRLISKSQVAPDNKLPKLLVLFPDMFRPIDIHDHLNMLSASSSGSYQLCQVQKSQSMATTKKQSISEMSDLDNHYEKSCQEVPILVSPAEEFVTKSKTSISTESENSQEIDCSVNSIEATQTLHNISSMNSTTINTLLMPKNQKPTIPRKLLNSNTKGLSPWPEMPKNINTTMNSQEFSVIGKIKKSLGTPDIDLNDISNIINKSQMGFTQSTNFHSYSETNSVKLINGTSSNLLQIPWTEIMRNIAYDDKGWWCNRILIEQDADIKMLPRPLDFTMCSTNLPERLDSTDLVQAYKGPILAQPWALPENDGIQQMSYKEQIVPQNFEKSSQKAIREPLFEKEMNDLVEHSNSSAGFHQCPEMIQEVVLISDIAKPEADKLMFEHTNDPLCCLEHHNYCSKVDARAMTPLSSSPWFVDQFNTSIAEIYQNYSPINASPPKDEKIIDNTALLENETEHDESLSNKESKAVVEIREQATDETYCTENFNLTSGQVKEDAQICPEDQLELIPNSMDTEDATVDEQTVPNPCLSMKSMPHTSAFMHTFEFEEFYSSSSLKKRVKTSRADGSNCRPLRLGLSKKCRVSPLHDLKTIRK